MKKLIVISLMSATVGIISLLANSCASTKLIEKSGNVLWSDNCGRCHNIPPSSVYNNEQWEIVGMHMKLRANLTEDETKKIVAFLKSGQ